MRFIRRALIFSVLICVPVSAQTEVKCDLSAFVADPSSGVNVRTGAGREFRVLKTVPRDEQGIMFDVVGAKGGWLKVGYAVNSENKPVFSGNGWVLANLLSIKTGGADALREKRLKIYKSPTRNGGLIPFSDFGIELPVGGCRENWVKVQLPAKGTAATTTIFGWMPAGAYCGNPWIECD